MNEPLTPEAALARGMEPITDPYAPDQLWMAHNALKGLVAGGIEAALVQTPLGIEVWRKKRVEQPEAPRKPGRSYGWHLLRGK